MTTFNTWAGTAGHITGRTWRALVWIESQIDWAEVGHIVWHGLLAFAVGVYVAGEFTGRWVHRTNDRLAALWVRLLVQEAPVSNERQTGVKFEVPLLLPAAPEPVPAFAIAAVPARCGVRRLAAEATTPISVAPPSPKVSEVKATIFAIPTGGRPQAV